MKRLQDHLKTISKALSALSKKIDQATTRIEKLQAAKPKSAKKAAPKKKAPAKKTVAKRKAAAEKPAAKKKTPFKKAAAKKKAPVKRSTALDSVLNVVNKSKKGITIAALKEKTGYNPKQLSNALYKLSKKDMITKKSRGVYLKK
jgi:hypothetical protein